MTEQVVDNKESGHNLERLRKLTEDLPPIQSLRDMVSERIGQLIEYDIERGVCIGIGLYNTPDVAVMRFAMPKGSFIARHEHKNEVEIIVVYKGKMEFKINGDVKVVETGEVALLPRHIAHTVEALEDSWMIALTIPASKDYADAR